jgi:hypothetical protein
MKDVFETAKEAFSQSPNEKEVFICLISGRYSFDDLKKVWLTDSYELQSEFYPIIDKILEENEEVHKAYTPFSVKVQKRGSKMYLVYDFRNTEGDIEYFTKKGKKTKLHNCTSRDVILWTVKGIVGIENPEYKKHEQENENDWSAQMFNPHSVYLNEDEIKEKVSEQEHIQGFFNGSGYFEGGHRSYYAIPHRDGYKIVFYVEYYDRGFDDVGLVCTSNGGFIYEMEVPKKVIDSL